MEKLYQSCADGAKDPVKPAAPIVRCCHYAIMWATLLGWPHCRQRLFLFWLLF